MFFAYAAPKENKAIKLLYSELSICAMMMIFENIVGATATVVVV